MYKLNLFIVLFLLCVSCSLDSFYGDGESSLVTLSVSYEGAPDNIELCELEAYSSSDTFHMYAKVNQGISGFTLGGEGEYQLRVTTFDPEQNAYTGESQNHFSSGPNKVVISLKEKLPPAPIAPEHFLLTISDTTQVELSWNRVSNADYYCLYMDSGTGFVSVDSIDGTEWNAHFERGTALSFKVTALNRGGESPFSATQSCTIETLPLPQTPENLHVASLDTTSCSIEWNSAQNCSEYVVLKGDGDIHPEQEVATVSGTTWSDSGLVVGNTYSYAVKGKGQYGISAASDKVTITTQKPLPGTPNKPTITSLNGSDVTVNWNPTVNSTGYIVLFSEGTNAPTDTVDTLTATSLTVTLEQGKTYTLAVKAYNVHAVSELSEYVVLTLAEEAPGTPSNLVVSSVSANEISLRWGSVNGATLYYIYRGENGSAPGATPFDSVASPEYSDSQVVPGTLYSYQVSAGNGVGESPRSESVSETVPLPTPAVPSGVNAEGISESSIRISWDAVTYAEGYVVFSSDSETGSFDSIGTVSTTEYIHGNLAVSQQKFYVVTAYNGVGRSDRSAVVQARTKEAAATIPDIPSGLQIGTVTAKTVALSWNSVNGASQYVLYRDNAEIASISGTSYVDSGRAANSTYHYAVSAKNSAGESSRSSEIAVTTSIDLTAPENVAATALSSSAILVSWNGVSGAEKYEVVRSISGTGSWNSVGETSSNSYEDRGLSSNMTYYYRVIAKAGTGVSDSSSVVSATTNEEIPVPATPGNISVSAVSSSEITVSFESVSGADGYRIYSSESISGTFSLIYDGTGTNYSHTALQANSTYYYRITAYNQSGESTKSSIESATTVSDIQVPETPSNLSAVAVSSSSISVTWGSVAGAEKYNLYRSESISGTYTEIWSGAGTSYSDGSLTASTTYYYKVCAENSAGESAQSSVVSASTESDIQIPATPSGLTGIAQSETSISLSWGSVSGAESYVIYVATSSYGTFTRQWEGAGSSVSMNGFSAGSTYYFKVSAKNGAGESAQSSAISVTTNSSSSKKYKIVDCRMCNKCAPPRFYCPQNAIVMDNSLGHWVIDPNLCDGCGDCVSLCKYGFIVLDN